MTLPSIVSPPITACLSLASGQWDAKHREATKTSVAAIKRIMWLCQSMGNPTVNCCQQANYTF
jgi:hypothetical protein